MPKFILNIILFLSYCFGIYLCTIFIWGTFVPSYLSPNLRFPKSGYGHLNTRIIELENYQNIDILFLGSSHAYRGFDTRIYEENGITCFNLGSSSQTPIQSHLLLKRYLDQLNPKLIIYEVNPWTLSNDGVESSLDLIANDQNDLLSTKMALTINSIKTYNALILGFIKDYINHSNELKESIVKGDDTYINGGYVEKVISYYTPDHFTPKTISPLDYQLNHFNKLVQLANEAGKDIVFVFAPIPKANYKSYNNLSYYDSLMSNKGNYLDLNQHLSLNDSLHFYDSLHLNQNGVKLFNEKLISILEKENLLP